MIVRGNVYALDMWTTEEIEVNNVKIVRVKDYREVKERIKREGRLYKTADLAIEASGVEGPGEAVAYAEMEVQDYSTLLSFSQGHDVPLGDLSCETVSRSLVGRIGRPEGAIIINSSGLGDFLATALPLIRNAEYANSTGVVRAIHFYNAAVNMEYAVVEMQHPLFFTGIEILANAHHWANPRSFAVDEQTWDSLQADIGEVFDLDPRYLPARDRVFGSLEFARASVRDKIEYLTSALGLPDYTADIRDIVEMRNDILHGRTLSATYGANRAAEVLLRSRRLLEKMVLKLLHFYDHRSVHPAFRADSLRATS